MNVNMLEEEMARRSVATIEAPTQACCVPVLAEPMSDPDAAELAKGFAALADPVRLRLLSILGSAQGGEVCACDLVEPVGKSQPTVSHHLKVLSEAGLVTGERRGRWVWYAVVPERFAQLRSTLETHA
jgi:ArsR family transcriptional regulator, arsenate/arsenite/antimonite-responsive transcriptional repressor